jgi:hypothetical protein
MQQCYKLCVELHHVRYGDRFRLINSIDLGVDRYPLSFVSQSASTLHAGMS